MSQHKINPFAFGTGIRRPPQTRDRYGRPLAPGDEVILVRPDPSQYVVSDVVPNLGPGAQPNTVRVVLVATASFIVPADTPVVNLLLIRRAEERGVVPDPGESPNGSEPPAPPDPTTN
jgi:hypothetical protein